MLQLLYMSCSYIRRIRFEPRHDIYRQQCGLTSNGNIHKTRSFRSYLLRELRQRSLLRHAQVRCDVHAPVRIVRVLHPELFDAVGGFVDMRAAGERQSYLVIKSLPAIIQRLEYADLISAHRAVERIAEAESEVPRISGKRGNRARDAEAFRMRHGLCELQHARRILRLDWVCCAHGI